VVLKKWWSESFNPLRNPHELYEVRYSTDTIALY
jgi:hypothetical protein